MKYFWFGDSWVVGDEINRIKNQQGKLIPGIFPELVSEKFQAQCVNLGQCGSSIDDIPYQFHSITNELSPDDVVFFCLTAKHRCSLFDQNGSLARIIPGEMYEKHRPHPHVDKWYKYFDTPVQQQYNYDKTINLMYFWTKALGVKSFFCNIFTIDTEPSLMDHTPTDAWLIPKNQCLASVILPVISTNNLYLDDHPSLTDQQWQQQKYAVEKYIRPNFQHPNAEGHEKIAEFIIENLDQNWNLKQS